MDDSTKELIASNLRRARWNKGWSQSFVARQLDISIRTISRAENGEGISKKILRKLCILYGINISAVYEKNPTKKTIRRNVLSEDALLRILHNQSFISDIEQETIHRFTDLIKSKAKLYRDDVEAIIPMVTNKNGLFSYSDVISCCIAVNMRTLEIVTELNMEEAL